MQINNNVASFNIWAQTRNSWDNASGFMGRLSSGVMDATDNPAGVGISERMRASISGVDMAVRNIDNGVSMLNTADSWKSSVGDMLSRMKSLAVQSGGVMSAGDRRNLNTEFKQMQQEITRITSGSTAAAKFNGLYITRGGTGGSTDGGGTIEPGQMEIQAGADEGQKIPVDLENLDASNTAKIGEFNVYTYDHQHRQVDSRTVEVTWDEVVNSASGVSVDSPDVIGKLEKAIEFVAGGRATDASQTNALQQRRSGMMSYSSNLRSAESKIRDVDMARTATAFLQALILGKSGQAMLAQANNLPSLALDLLFAK